MIKRISIPSDDVYTYEKQALDMLSKAHPHYDEVYKHLYNQVRDQLDDICYRTTNTPADTAGEDTDISGTQAS